MTRIIPNEEFICNNYDKVISLIKQFVKEQRKQTNLLDLIESYKERYALCPASNKKDFYSCFPGGLIYHSLQVLKNCMTTAKTFYSPKEANKSINPEPFLITSLLHEFGKIGDEYNEYYLPTENNWQIDNGIFYDINPKIQYMRIPHRSLYMAQLFEINLSQDEYLTILLSDNDEENKYYNFKESELTTIFKFADKYSIQEEKKNNIIYPLPE